MSWRGMFPSGEHTGREEDKAGSREVGQDGQYHAPRVWAVGLAMENGWVDPIDSVAWNSGYQDRNWGLLLLLLRSAPVAPSSPQLSVAEINSWHSLGLDEPDDGGWSATSLDRRRMPTTQPSFCPVSSCLVFPLFCRPSQLEPSATLPEMLGQCSPQPQCITRTQGVCLPGYSFISPNLGG